MHLLFVPQDKYISNELSDGFGYGFWVFKNDYVTSFALFGENNLTFHSTLLGRNTRILLLAISWSWRDGVSVSSLWKEHTRLLGFSLCFQGCWI